jgi:hypothetical protein
MPELIDKVASQTGLDPETTQKGLGVVLSFIKEHLGEEAFAKVQSFIPQAEAMISTFESSRGASSGGFLGMLSDLASKLLGGQAQEGAKLLAAFSQAGLDPEQIKTFLPRAIEALKNHLPPELVERIMARVPGLAALLGAHENEEAARP